MLIDYGHNVPALEVLDGLVSGLGARRRICVASARGNRRDADIMGLGSQIATMHDRLYVCETHPRGREPGEAAGLVKQGADGVGGCPTEIVISASDAGDRALDHAEEGDLLVRLVDDLADATHRVKGRSFRPALVAGG